MKMSVTNEQIVAVLEAFGLPVFYGEFDGDSVDDWNFFYYTDVRLEKPPGKVFQQTVVVYLVSRQRDVEKEMDVIEKLEAVKINFVGPAEYDRFKLADTDGYINVIAFPFTRLIKRSC